MSTDQPGVTAASEPLLAPSLFDQPDPKLFDQPDPKTTTPGNGHAVVPAVKRHRFVQDDTDVVDTPEEVKAVVEAVHVDEADEIDLAAPHDKPRGLTKSERRKLGRLRARKVKRIVRRVDPWSVLKLSLLFYTCLFVVFMVAGTLLWNLAGAAGTISSIESFIKDIGAFKTFEFNGATIFRATFLAGLILVIAGSALNVLLVVLFNLISDLVGGIRITVIEEDSARPITAEGDRGKR